MPEGDSVYRSCAQLQRALAGRVLTRAELRVPQAATARQNQAVMMRLVAVAVQKHDVAGRDQCLIVDTRDAAYRLTRR